MTRLRLHIGLFLAFVLTISTFGIGMARGHLPVAGEMIICAGEGAVSVTVDVAGRPVQRLMLCPEKSGLLLTAVAVPQPAPIPVPPRQSRCERSDATTEPYVRNGFSQGARAPPLA
ncbi:hypothetical protein [Tropicimonas sp.]|uniref:hypothetical protein n=1 Tax=Tropicimonas sp. TaxID=2067044 RepID=UPI003A886849